MNRPRQIAVYTWICRFVASRWFFVASLLWFGLQAAWLALSGIYPLPFDEYYHFGISRIYSEQWSPFITTQPAEASLYGDITRYPSYLFHYLLSFPLRLIESVITDQNIQITLLRFISIALFIWGIYLFRSLLLQGGLSRRTTHLVLLVFVALPITPFLAAHITYDSAIFVLTALLLIHALRIIQARQLEIRSLIYVFIVGCFGSITKETFLPLFGIVILYLSVILIRRHGRRILHSFMAAIRTQSIWWLIIALPLVSIGSALFIERYGVNLARYHNYSPACDDIHPITVCEDYMPWYRNYQNALNPPAELAYGNPVSYTQHWFTKIMRGYFAIFSHTPTEVVWDREPFGPIIAKALLPLPVTGAYLLLIIGLFSIITVRRLLWRQAFFRFALVLIGAYTAVVWAFNYQTYLAISAAQAIQARYFLPLFILILAVFAQAIVWALRSVRPRLILLALIGICLVYSGGIVGWIIRADPTWYWQHPFIMQINESLRNLFSLIIPH